MALYSQKRLKQHAVHAWKNINSSTCRYWKFPTFSTPCSSTYRVSLNDGGVALSLNIQVWFSGWKFATIMKLSLNQALRSQTIHFYPKYIPKKQNQNFAPFLGICTRRSECSPFPSSVAKPAGESVLRKSTVWPGSRTGPGPVPASSHTPAPGTSTQTEHPPHWYTHSNTSQVRQV